MSNQSAPAISLIPAKMYHALTVAHAEIARLRLTNEERAAVGWAISAAENVMHPADAPLRNLLERLG